MSDRPKTSEKRPALGRGLSALIPDGATLNRDERLEIDIDLLRPNPRQPRNQLDEGRLDQLAASIKTSGVIQPILARRSAGTFEIVAGERRWRAAQRAGLLRVPVTVRDVPDDKLLEFALIENVQREDLNPVDQARAYRRLIEELALTQDQVASAVGRDRTSIANLLRLLKLPEPVLAMVATDALPMGHARALLGLADPDRIEATAKIVVEKGFSVRETEQLVRRLNEPPRPSAEAPPKDVHTKQAEERLRLALGTRVRIVRKGTHGRLEIDFVSEDELQRLYEHLTASETA